MINEVREPPSGSYFMTVTLKPKLYKYSSVTQYELTSTEIAGKLNNNCNDFEMVPEHTKQGNIHYHAWIFDERAHARFAALNALKKLRCTGFVQLTPEVIDTPEAKTRVKDYLSKELLDTNRLLKPTVRKSLIFCKEDFFQK